MSFSWANKLAKTAFITAQRQIDSVLDIQDEESSGENVAEEEEDNILNEEGQHKHEGQEKSSTDISPQQFSAYLEKLVVNAVQSPTTDWNSSQDDHKEQEVVDAEPNPIRDAHEKIISSNFHYSPSSNSPDEEEGQGNGVATRDQLQEQSTTSLDLSLITMETENLASSVKSGFSDKTADGPEEEKARKTNVASTIASSDIEVIQHKYMDEWSVTSSTNHSSRLLGGGDMEEISLNPVVKEVINSSVLLHQQQQTSEQLAILNAKLRHRDHKIEELNKSNEQFKEANAILTQKNKQILVRATAETKLQKQLVEKEKELNELMDEGKRLSEHSGKQSKEIRRLKQQVAQLEVVTAARDSAMEELQAAHQRIMEQSKEVEELNEKLKKAEVINQGLEADFNSHRATTDEVEKHVADQQSQLASALFEIDRLKAELKSNLQEKQDLSSEVQNLSSKLINKRALDCLENERERGHLEDLSTERTRNTVLTSQVRDLERRIESLMDTQRDVAAAIADTNSPLLANIQTLECKIYSLEKQNETLSNQIKKANESAWMEKQKAEQHCNALANKLEELRQKCEQKDEELDRSNDQTKLHKSQLNDLESRFLVLKIERDDLAHASFQRIQALTEELTAKQKECTQLRSECVDLQQTSKTLLPPHITPPPAAPSEEASKEMFTTSLPDNSMSGDVHTPRSLSRRPTESGIRVDLSSNQTSTNEASKSEQQESIGAGTEHLRNELEDAHEQLFQLHKKFDRLLEIYGGCLETIEELKMDNQDLRALCKEQALQLTPLQPSEPSENSSDR